jgi:hypothetical protein
MADQELRAELHDCQRRLGAVEHDVTVLQTQASDQAGAQAASTSGRDFWITTALAVVSTVAFVLALLPAFGIRL